MGNKVTTKKEIINRIVNERDKLASFGVVGIGLFGSLAKLQKSCRKISRNCNLILNGER